MAEYIDKKIAIMVHEPPKSQRYYQTDNLDDAYGQGWDDALNAIGKLQTANVKEIIYAHWEKADGMGYYRCSHCKTVDDKYYQPEYCPHCGAEMSEVVDCRMTNREWLMNQSKEEIITNVSNPCPYRHCPDILKSCTECWIDWLDEEHKEPDEPEN